MVLLDCKRDPFNGAGSPWVQPALRGTSDVFVTRLSVPSLTIAFSTYLGDSGGGVAMDGAGALVVAGTLTPQISQLPVTLFREVPWEV